MRNFTKIGILALLFFACATMARPVPARIVLPDGQDVQCTFLELKADTVYYTVSSGEGDAYKTEEFKLYKFDVKKVQLTEDGSLVDLSLTDYLVKTDAPKDSVVQDTTPQIKEGGAMLVIESYPSDARVYVDNIMLEGLTPLTIPKIDAKKHQVMVRKYLKGVDWWGSARIETKDGDTTKVNIKLLKPHTQLTVQTNPTEAEIYIDQPHSLKVMPTLRSDTTIMDIRPSMETTIYVFKVGYYDTSLTMPIEAFMPNLVGIELHPVTDDLNKLQEQIDFVAKRKNKWIGRGLLWSSIAPLVAGLTMVVLADRDWAEAADFKLAYQDAAFESSETDRFVRENKKFNDAGDLKAKIGAGLGGLALVLASVGLVMQF